MVITTMSRSLYHCMVYKGNLHDLYLGNNDDDNDVDKDDEWQLTITTKTYVYN